MLRSIRRPLLACAAAAVLAAGCDSGQTPTTPTDPGVNPPTVTQTFSGTINPNGSLSFQFETGGSGQVTAAITTITPEDTVLGLSLGVWTVQQTCQVVVANDSAARGAQVIGNVSQRGVLCARIHDVGKITSAVPFEVTVVHP